MSARRRFAVTDLGGTIDSLVWYFLHLVLALGCDSNTSLYANLNSRHSPTEIAANKEALDRRGQSESNRG